MPRVRAIFGAFLALLLGAAVPAFAGVGGSGIPNFPPGVKNVGDTFTASLVVTNESRPPSSDEHPIDVTSIFLVPSCASGGFPCSSPDKGVFSVAALFGPPTNANPAIDGPNACAGMTFLPSAPEGLTGRIELIAQPPGTPVTLGPANGPTATTAKKCTVNFTVTVQKKPAFDSTPPNPPLTTNVLAFAFLTDLVSCVVNPTPPPASFCDTGGGGGSVTAIISGPELTIQKTPDASSVNAGQVATFTIVVTNTGTGAATNVHINDSLPNGGSLTWATGSAGCSITGSGASQALTCTFASMAANGSVTLEAHAATSPQACATLDNTATAIADNFVNANGQLASVQDSGTITCQTPVLTIAKTPDGATITAGATATFTIVVTNIGPGTATNVTLSDALPAGGGVTWTTTAPCTVSGQAGLQVLHCPVGSLNQGSGFTAAVSAVTSAGKCTSMPNTASATASNAAGVQDTGSITCRSPCAYSMSPLDLSNRSAAGGAASIIVTTPAGCAVTVTSFQPWVSVNSITPNGGTTTIQLQISPNAGAARATPIQVADRLFLITQLGP